MKIQVLLILLLFALLLGFLAFFSQKTNNSSPSPLPTFSLKENLENGFTIVAAGDRNKGYYTFEKNNWKFRERL